MKYFLITLCACILILLAILIINALRLKPEKARSKPAAKIEFDNQAALNRFGAVIQAKTIWPRYGKIDLDPFNSFLPLLKAQFPVALNAMKVNIINDYGILLEWSGRDVSAEPVVLMSHYDVVPANEESWSNPPFCGNVIDGEIWGRGAVDTKCILCALLESSEALIKQGFSPKRTVYFSFTNNEETGGDTTPAIVNRLKECGVRPLFVLDEGGAVVNSPALGVKHDFAMIGVSEKGVIDLTVAMNGEPGHSSTPKGSDSTTRLIEAVSSVQKHSFNSTLSPVTKTMLKSIAAYSGIAYRLIFGNLWLFSPLVKLIMNSNPETAAMLKTTAALTKLKSSGEINVIPNTAYAAFSVRIAPWDTTDKVLKSLQAICGEHAEVGFDYKFEPSPISPFDGEGIDIIKAAVAQTYPGVPCVPYIMNGGTDSKHFTAICPNVYRFAGFRFSAAERASMHGNDERLNAQSYLDGVQFYVNLIEQL